MTIYFRFDAGWNCILSRFLGKADVGEFEAFLDALGGDDRIRAGHLRLTDLRGLADEREVRRLQSFAKLSTARDKLIPPARAALLVGYPVDFGMARLYVSNLEERQEVFNVFRELNAALTWLGLPSGGEDPFHVGEWREIRSG